MGNSVRIRKKIGLLCGDVKDDYSRAIIKGAISAARELDVDLIMIPGKYYKMALDAYEYRYEYQFNALYSFANKHNLDALVILAGAIGPFSEDPGNRAYINKFTDKYKGMPVVSVALSIPGWSSIKYDNGNAIKEGIHYLVNEQNCRKIGMVAGALDSEDSLERVNAYREALLVEDLEIDESLIAYGDFTSRSREIIYDFIDKHRNLDAVIFANDVMAKEGYAVMERLGLKVGTDIAFLGFDDVDESVKLIPPLASVKADATGLGYEATKLAVRNCDMRTEKQVVLPTKLVIRESMQRVQTKQNRFIEIFRGNEKEAIDFYEMSQEVFDDLFDRRDTGIDREAAMRLYEPAFNCVTSLFSKKFLQEDDFDALYEEFYNFVLESSKFNLDNTKLIRIFDSIMASLRERYDDTMSKAAINSATTRIYKRMVEILDTKSNEKSDFKTEIYHQTNMIAKSMFAFESGSDQNYRTILNNLGLLGVKNAYLFLFDHSVINLLEDDFRLPKYMYLKACLNGNDVTVPAKTKQKTGTDRLYDVCSDYAGNKRLELLMLDLFCDEEQYGILLCDIPYEYFENVEQVLFQASIAIRMLKLLKNENSVQEQLENSLALLKKNNIELDYLSKRDELTRIYNRRGFYQKGAELLAGENGDKFVMVVYADTDNLKIINDRYGHDEGDFAIRSCSSILSEVLGEYGIVGRIGGDEFAAVALTDHIDLANEVRKNIDRRIKKLNDESDKPYVVRMSVGISVLKWKEDIEIKDLLESADALLYKEKKNRRKEIVKSSL